MRHLTVDISGESMSDDGFPGRPATRSLARALARSRPAIRFVRFDAAGRGDCVDPLTGEPGQALAALGSTDALLDLAGEAGWSPARTELYERFSAAGVKILSLVDDLAPPEDGRRDTDGTDRRDSYLRFVAATSDLAVLYSRASARRLARQLAASGQESDLATVVIGVGPDADEASGVDDVVLPAEFRDSEFILVTGDVGASGVPSVALAAARLLRASHPDVHLVFLAPTGSSGAIHEHALFGRRIHLVEHASVALASALRRRCTIALCLSSDGTGGESLADCLSVGTVTVTSFHDALYEVGGGYADYVHYNAPGEVAETLIGYLRAPGLVVARRAQVRDGFHLPDWNLIASTVSAVVDNLDRADVIAATPLPSMLQWVFISNRPKSLRRTVATIDANVPWASEYVVVGPRELRDAFEELESARPIVFVAEEDVLGEDIAEFRRVDHVRKNWMLRSRLVDLELTGDEFIMLDDDNQPIDALSIDVFFGNRRRYYGYYFYDLERWPHRKTEYDLGIECTGRTVAEAGLERLAYSSHQPQVINKEIFRQARELVAGVAPSRSVEEWSVYFNYVASRYPTLLARREFTALSWPEGPWSWQAQVVPADPAFENYYPRSYKHGSTAELRRRMSSAEKSQRMRDARAPYERSAGLFASSRSYVEQLDMAHGAMVFSSGVASLLVGGVPHVITTGASAPERLALTFALVGASPATGTPGAETQFCYRIAATGATSGIAVEARSTAGGWAPNGIIELDFPGVPLAPGVYELEFYARFDGLNVVVPDATYRSRLVVCGPDETVPAVYADL